MRRPKRNSSRPSTASDPVQTFLPYASFRRSARVLDSRRLGKQRVETLQVLRALEIEDYGWKSHPVVRMWRGYTEALVTYGKEMVVEWKMRGFGDSCFERLMEFAPHARSQRALAQAGALPSWLGDRAFHRSHRSVLVQKDPSHYRPLFPGVPEDLPYVWPQAEHAPPALGPWSAWIVRADNATLARFRKEQLVAIPKIASGPRVSGKAARQVRAFRDGSARGRSDRSATRSRTLGRRNPRSGEGARRRIRPQSTMVRRLFAACARLPGAPPGPADLLCAARRSRSARTRPPRGVIAGRAAAFEPQAAHGKVRGDSHVPRGTSSPGPRAFTEVEMSAA